MEASSLGFFEASFLSCYSTCLGSANAWFLASTGVRTMNMDSGLFFHMPKVTQMVIACLPGQPPCPYPGVAIWLACTGAALAQAWREPQGECCEKRRRCVGGWMGMGGGA